MERDIKIMMMHFNNPYDEVMKMPFSRRRRMSNEWMEANVKSKPKSNSMKPGQFRKK